MYVCICAQFQQTAKLDMYKSIVGVIGVFAILFTLYSILVLMSKCLGLQISYMIYAWLNMYILWCMYVGNRGFISLPWQLNWVQTVVFESLNFSVLAALCIVCRPTGIPQIMNVGCRVCLHACPVRLCMYVCMYVCASVLRFLYACTVCTDDLIYANKTFNVYVYSCMYVSIYVCMYTIL